MTTKKIDLHKYEVYLLPNFYLGYSPKPHIHWIYEVVVELQIFWIYVYFTNWHDYSKYLVKPFSHIIEYIPDEQYFRIFGLELDWECV